MEDLSKVDRNVKRLVEQGAPDADIQAYLDHVGVTPEQLIKTPSSSLGMAVDFVDRTAKRVGNSISGPSDPREAQTGTVYDQFTDDLRSPTATAAMGGANDVGMGDVIQKHLGDRFLRREKDANGYEVMVTRGPDGQEQRGYVNKPGLDAQDAWRTFYGAAPYLLGGGTAAAALKNAPTAVKVGSQMLTAGGISLGGDKVAQGEGSQQPVDLKKAAGVAALGGAAEVIPPQYLFGALGLGAGAMGEGTADQRAADAIGYGLGGFVGGKALTKAVQKNPNRHLENGKLASDEAIRKAQAAGLNPDDLDPQAAEMFARGIDNLADPKELASLIQTNRFGIPTTKATRTKDPKFSAIEKDIRAGNMGDDAKSILDEFDKTQQQELAQSALRRAPASDAIAAQREAGIPGNPYKEGMGAVINPQRLATKPDELWPSDLGESITQGLKQAKDVGDAKISEAWGKAGDFEAMPEAFAALPGFVESSLGKMRLTPANTPTAMKMESDLADYVSGKGIATEGPRLIKQTPIRTMEDMRRHLLESYKTAKPGTPDYAASKSLYSGFDDWFDDVVEKQLIKGNIEEAVGARTAREITREVKQLFKPNMGRGPESKIIQKIIDSEATPDSVLNDVLGASGPTTAANPVSIRVINQIKSVLNPKAGLVDETTSMRVINDIRMAYWSRLVINKKGQMHTPDMAANNITAALRNQIGVIGALFTPAEARLMKQYAGALREAAFKDPNPSGTASALRAMQKNENNSWLKTILQTQSKRELFSKHNVMMSRFYSMLAKNAPASIFGSKEFAGTAAARRAVSQQPTLAPGPSFAPAGAIAGAQAYRNR